MSETALQLRPEQAILLDPDRALAGAASWKEAVIIWETLIGSGMLPKSVKTPAQAVAITRYGKVFGWDPIRSLHAIHVIEGKCTIAAEAMMSLIIEHARRFGDVVTPVDMTNIRAAIKVQRAGLDPEPVVVEFTAEDAKLAGLAGKGNHKGYPADMLWARCVSRVGRRLYSDLVQGAYVHGELGHVVPQATGYRVSQLRTLPSAPERQPGEDDEPIPSDDDREPPDDAPLGVPS